MEVYPDFKELLRLFNKNRIDYIIVGAYALAFHGSPRYTGDLDILVKPEQDNAANIQSVFKTVACLLTRRRRVNKHAMPEITFSTGPLEGKSRPHEEN